jgi:hypothetical protein
MNAAEEILRGSSRATLYFAVRSGRGFGQGNEPSAGFASFTKAAVPSNFELSAIRHGKQFGPGICSTAIGSAVKDITRCIRACPFAAAL